MTSPWFVLDTTKISEGDKAMISKVSLKDQFGAHESQRIIDSILNGSPFSRTTLRAIKNTVGINSETLPISHFNK